LELGGNAPFIVFDDADLDMAVNAVMAAKFRNAGQACIAANRVLVQDKVYDAFAAKLATAVKALKVGNGLAADSTVGPLINAKGLEKVTAHVEHCKELGAQILAGGQPSPINDTEGGYFFNPTIISNATKEMLPFCQETFGPIVPLMKFTTDEEAIELANDTE
jgi:succinate-semialdehyde dehydrogenase/glutarate-semialdehyde dehydrogenase